MLCSRRATRCGAARLLMPLHPGIASPTLIYSCKHFSREGTTADAHLHMQSSHYYWALKVYMLFKTKAPPKLRSILFFTISPTKKNTSSSWAIECGALARRIRGRGRVELGHGERLQSNRRAGVIGLQTLLNLVTRTL